MKYLRLSKRRLATIGLIFLVVAFSACHAIEAKYVIEYDYMNGALQNYNGVRRLLVGQTPYVDFVNYLGLGHLYSIAAMLLVLGNNFAASVASTQFLTVFYATLSLAAVIWLVVKKLNTALLASLAAMLLIKINGYVGALLFPTDSPQALMWNVGNSARMIRSSIIFLFVFFLLIYHFLTVRLAARFCWSNNIRATVFEMGSSAVCGLVVLWSNDMGPSVYVGYSIFFFFLLLRRHKRNFLKILLELVRHMVVSLTALFLGILVATSGHVGQWFSTTLGNASYQFWYYDFERKDTSLLNLDLGYGSLIILALLGCFVVYMIKNRNEETRFVQFGLLAFLCFTCFFSTNVYRLGAGNTSN